MSEINKINLCLVTEFEQENLFQWEIALKNHPRIDTYSTIINPATLKEYPPESLYWDQIRKADIVFVYCVRHDETWEWYKLPVIVKKWMNQKAKMICQFDLEFLWLWYPDHHPWKTPVTFTSPKTPEEFFMETGVLDVADIYIVIFNPLLKECIKKPVYYLPLPQLVRHESLLDPTKNNFDKIKNATKHIVLLQHSVKSASIDETIENIVNKLDDLSNGKKYQIDVYTTRNTSHTDKMNMREKIKYGSEIFGKLPRNSYMEFLDRGLVAIDDNEGYYGWSRFAMECALTCVPCIGSTLAVKEFFPELYVEHGDYRAQKELINKLIDDEGFWLKTATTGRKNVLEKMNTNYLIEKLLSIINFKESVLSEIEPKTGVYLPHISKVASKFTRLHNITIIIPTYNQKKLLMKTLRLLKPQLRGGDRILIVDDGGSDGTKEAVEEKFPFVKYMYQEHKGLSSALSEGLKNIEIIDECENIIIVRPEETISKKFIYSIMNRIWLGPRPEETKPSFGPELVESSEEKEEREKEEKEQEKTEEIIIPKINIEKVAEKQKEEIIVKKEEPVKEVIIKVEEPTKIVEDEENVEFEEYQKYRVYVNKFLPIKTIPMRPSGDSIAWDGTSKKFLSEKEWDDRYGKWKKFIDGHIPDKNTPFKTVISFPPSNTKTGVTCLYASEVHTSVIKPLELYLKKIGQEVVWSTPYGLRKVEERKSGYPPANIYITCSSEHRDENVYDITKTVFVSHGLSPAELECFPAHEMHRFKGALLSGQWYLDKINEGVWEDGLNSRNKKYGKWNVLYPEDFFKVVGWMKGDILFSSEIDEIVERYKKELNLKLPYEKTILYSPTGYWRMGYGCFDKTIFPLIDAINYLEMNLVIKLHFCTIKYEPCKTIYFKARDKTIDSKNITWIHYNELDDITPLYKIADTLVSDASSTLLEFLQVNKPSIEVLERDPPVTENMREDWRGFLMPEGTTIRCWETKNLKSVLTRAVYYPDEREKERLEWQKKLFYKLDGKATERTWNAIKDVVG